MTQHFYKNTNLDMNKIVEELRHKYEQEHFQVQHVVDQNHGIVQIKKSGVVRAATGFGKAITVRMQQEEGGLRARVGVEDWVAKLAAAGIAGILLPLITMAPAIIGSIDEAHFAQKVMDEVDHLVLEQAPGIEIERHHPKK
jgi:hypothetical protein